MHINASRDFKFYKRNTLKNMVCWKNLGKKLPMWPDPNGRAKVIEIKPRISQC